MACSFRSLSWSTGTLCTGCCVGAVTGGGQKRLLTKRLTISPISMKLIEPNRTRKGREKAIPPEWKPGEFGGRGALGGMPLPAYSPQACVHAMFFPVPAGSTFGSGRGDSRAELGGALGRSGGPSPILMVMTPQSRRAFLTLDSFGSSPSQKVPRRKLKMLIYWDELYRGAGEV